MDLSPEEMAKAYLRAFERTADRVNAAHFCFDYRPRADNDNWRGKY